MKDQVKMRDLCWISCFCCFSGAFSAFRVLFMETNKTRSICGYTCTIYTYIHHQIPPKYKIYLVGLPSVLYERTGQNETSVLNKVFCCFSGAFQSSSCTFHGNKQNQVNMCVSCTIYTYIHHQIPPKYKIYLVGLPSVLYETPGQNERSVFWISCFCYFSCALHRECWFSCKKYHISWKPTRPAQYVCIHVPFTHTCTTKYHQNMIYLVGLPLCTLWKTRSK